MTAYENLEGASFLDVEDAIYVSGTVYAKTAEAAAAVRAAMAAAGYTFEDGGGGFAKLEGVDFTECGNCGGAISNAGTLCHNHRCELCGKPTYLEYVRGGTIRLAFIRNRERVHDGTISFRVFEYRDDARELALYAVPLLDSQSIGDARSPEAAKRVLDAAAGLYRRETAVDGDGKEVDLIVVREDLGPLTPESVFDTYAVHGSERHCHPIRVFRGRKYGTFEDLPWPAMVSVSERFVGSRLSLADPSAHEAIMLAAGQTPSADFYHQDGRPAFGEVVFKRWDAFVRHFVDVDYAKWRQFARNAPRGGPAFIYALARWCADMSDGKRRRVTDEPNMGNTLAAMGKLLSGQPLTYREAVAAQEGEQELVNELGGPEGAFNFVDQLTDGALRDAVEDAEERTRGRKP
jgi:hypothetical protein